MAFPFQTSNPWTKKLERVLDMADEDRAVLDRLASPTKRHGAGDMLVEQGIVPAHVHVVIDGCLACYKFLSDGRRQNVALLLPGDIWGLNVFVRTETDHAIAATVPTLVAKIPRDEFLAQLHSRPMLSTALWWNALRDEAILREWVVNLGARRAVERIAHLFYEIYLRLEAVGRTVDNGFFLPLTQAELGETTGLSPVHVNRTVQALRKDGLVRLEGRMLTIPDPRRLKAAADFDTTYLQLGRATGAPGYRGPGLPLTD